MDTENGIQSKPRPGPLTGASYHLRTFHVSLNLLCHILIGIIVGVILVCVVFRQPMPLGYTPIHIILCVLGYQLLMAQAILSMSPYNTWSTHLKLVDKKRAHWILQILGSALAIAGSFVKIMDKELSNAAHWTTPHGICALVALVFTVASLISGLTSLYAYEFRKCLPSKLSKITHICFGIVAFAAANITLCHGLEKGLFRGWLVVANSDPVVNTLITFIALLTSIIIVAPLITFYQKFKTN